MTAFAVPCSKCGKGRDDWRHNSKSPPTIPAAIAMLHEYRPDEGSLEFAAVELTAALSWCRDSCYQPQACGAADNALALAESLGITKEVPHQVATPTTCQEREPTGLATLPQVATAVASPASPVPGQWDAYLLGRDDERERCRAVSRGCLDYGGGYRSDGGKLDIFHHGIQTVINALAAEPADTQVRALEAMGRGPVVPFDVLAAPVGRLRPLVSDLSEDAHREGLEPGTPEHEAAVLRDGFEGRR